MTNTKRWSPTDPVRFLGLTVRQLEARLVEAEKFAEKHPECQLGWHNEYRHELKKHIAEKIGR